MRDITVFYLKPPKESFISNIVNTHHLLGALSHYVKVVTVTTDIKSIDLKKLEDLNIDYLWVNIKNFGPMQFILREKQQANIPFMIMLHTVYAWFKPLVQIIPLIRKEDIIIAPSEYAKNSFLKIARKLKVYVMPMCLDVRQIQRNVPHNLKTHKKEICFMGRLTQGKGIDTLIDCMPDIISGAGDVHLNIIGPLSGEDIRNSPKSPFVKKLERKVIRTGLANNIHFLGLKLGLEKYKILSEANVFVNLTTSREETFTVANIDALACGVPVIAAKWADNKKMVREGENGYLIDVECNKDRKPRVNTEQFISCIINVLKERRLNVRLRKNAAELARNYDYRQIMPKLVKLLKKRKNLKTKNGWESIKNRKVSDFSHLFNKDFCFFLYYFSPFRTETYALLYRKISKLDSLESQYHPNRRDIRRINARNTKDLRLTDKIRRNFSDFLLLESNYV